MIREGMSELHTVKTAIHEPTHALLHLDKTANKSSAEKETEAESVAYVVCSALGLDTGEYSFPYLASWSESQYATRTQKQFVYRKEKQPTALLIKSVKNLILKINVNS